MSDHQHPHDHQHDSDQEAPLTHHHACSNLFGCGDELGTGVLREDIKDAAVTRRSSDRLLHMDEMDQETLDGYLGARGRARRKLLRASSFMGVLATVGPWFGNLAFGKLAYAAGREEIDTEPSAQGKAKHSAKADDSKVHVVESNDQTVHLGVFDANLPPVVKIDSGDSVSFPQFGGRDSRMAGGVARERSGR